MVLNHVTATDNGHGLYFFGFNPSTTDVAISNSVVSNNSVGIDVTGNGGALTVSVDNTTLNGNGTAIFGLSPAAVMLSRSVIQGNGVGTNNQTSNTFYTYSNNLIDLNGQNFMGGALYSGVTLR